jgi:hypothetical protein
VPGDWYPYRDRLNRLRKEGNTLTQKEIVMICGGFALFAFGPLYGYRIGALGKRRFWSLKKIKRLAFLPLLIPGAILFIVSFMWRLSPDYLGGATWAIFPCAVSFGAGSVAMFVASKVARPGGVLLEADEKD